MLQEQPDRCDCGDRGQACWRNLLARGFKKRLAVNRTRGKVINKRNGILRPARGCKLESICLMNHLIQASAAAIEAGQGCASAGDL